MTKKAGNIGKVLEAVDISLEELLKDKHESLADIQNCTIALRIGIIEYSSGSVQERLDINQKIVNIINEELKRRNMNSIKLTPSRKE